MIIKQNNKGHPTQGPKCRMGLALKGRREGKKEEEEGEERQAGSFIDSSGRTGKEPLYPNMTPVLRRPSFSFPPLLEGKMPSIFLLFPPIKSPFFPMYFS